MSVEPTPEHRWLTQLLGDWTWETETVPGHEHPTMSGTEIFRSFGGTWVQGHATGDHGDSQMTLGFDPRFGRFVGTWIGTMMNSLWVYDGELNPTRTRLALHSVGPSFAEDGTLARYIDEIELVGDDERVLRASVEGADGVWTQFMQTRYRRR